MRSYCRAGVNLLLVMESIFSLCNKTILVTGASSGIGRSVALRCAEFGANLVVSGRNEERLTDVYKQLDRNLGQTHTYIVADITHDEDICTLTSSVDGLDGIVHCAGINDKSLLKFIDRDKIEAMFDINCFAPILLMKEFVKHKKLNKNASIVFISSISATYATISNTLYASSKGAVNSLIRVLALELASKHIRVNGIMPGMVQTDMMKAYGLTDEELREVEKGYPLGRLGEPSDIANAVIYYLSNASSWVTGTNLTIDGGITLR